MIVREELVNLDRSSTCLVRHVSSSECNLAFAPQIVERGVLVDVGQELDDLADNLEL